MMSEFDLNEDDAGVWFHPCFWMARDRSLDPRLTGISSRQRSRRYTMRTSLIPV
jgi:hypothetical protein